VFQKCVDIIFSAMWLSCSELFTHLIMGGKS